MAIGAHTLSLARELCRECRRVTVYTRQERIVEANKGHMVVYLEVKGQHKGRGRVVRRYRHGCLPSHLDRFSRRLCVSADHQRDSRSAGNHGSYNLGERLISFGRFGSG